MKNLITRLFIFVLLLFPFLLLSSIVQAQIYKPALVMSPDTNVQIGAIKDISLSMVNMGVPLKRVEVTVRLSGEFDQNFGLGFEKVNTEQYGLNYETHYFRNFAGRKDVQDLTVVFNAMDPQGYNQGSAQVPLVNIRYKAVRGYFSAMVVSSKLTDNKGNLLASVDTFGTTNYHANVEPPPFMDEGNSLDLRQYNLSFNTDPVRMWWPTAPNSVQQIDAGLWRDGDANNVQNFTNLTTEWQVDSNFIEITDTASSYLSNCAPVQMSNNRPCIHFAAHAKTKKVGTTYVSLRIKDNVTGHEITNGYPVEIYSVESTPTPQASSVPIASPLPSPSFIPEDKVSTKEFKEVEQKVTYLQSQLDQQQQELNETQSIVTRITNFLKRLFRFKS